jgi:hypothetical protein
MHYIYDAAKSSPFGEDSGGVKWIEVQNIKITTKSSLSPNLHTLESNLSSPQAYL